MNLFTKTAVSAALATTFLSAGVQAESVKVYGKLNVSVQSQDAAASDQTAIQSNASRLGVKGNFDLGNGLTAIYQIEYEVDTGSESKENFKARNQFVGLTGNFGQVTVGRQDTMLKVSQGKVDQFNDLAGDLKTLFKGENRLNQTLNYVSPKFADIAQVGVTYVADGDADQKVNGMNEKVGGLSSTLMFGDAGLKKKSYYASVAYDSTVKAYDIIRATGHVKVGALKLGAMVQQQNKHETFSDSIKVPATDKQSGYLVSAAYSITEALAVKTQYQNMQNGNLADLEALSFGADYQLAKTTKLYGFYTKRDNVAAKNDNVFGLGIEQKF
ncbi:porin [Paraferrimonas sp. SM1919]|uniref:porin n=1 Tax=Paraferrimonas sp. SM1919 TaxID=2662263 RepID=UPI0013D319CC|nr:porin [Paraferrimonas sp. SM1919]